MLIWDPELGKGFDDFKEECIRRGLSYSNNCLRINSDDFIRMTQTAFKNADENYLSTNPSEIESGIKIRQTSEWRSELYHYLYEEQIKQVLYP